MVDLSASIGFFSILVVIYEFSKMLDLISLKDSSNNKGVPAVFFRNVVKLYVLPFSIISNCNHCVQSIV